MKIRGGVDWKLLFCGVLLVCGLWGLVAYGRGRHRANYPIAPAEFCEQTTGIRTGMTAAQVETMLRGVTTVIRGDGDIVLFQMEPHEKRPFTDVSYFISIRLDNRGRVLESRCFDG